MSGFVGIVNLDGGPVDGPLLQRMTRFMEFRGPDRQSTWHGGHVAFGHALLATREESARERQPLTLNDQHWVVGDIRIDARGELQAELSARGEGPAPDATDAALVLAAYRTWGERCVEHLIGDFAFAIWDAGRRQLFSARDQLGVKPLFYACVGPTVLVSNTIDCLRLHPGVSDRLNDLAIADFLLFELNQDPATTVFADIQRVPPAHTARWSPAGSSVQRYWTLPIDEPLFYRRAGDYVDRFNELIGAAVSDRLRTTRVGIFMSGGIDSTALASVASRTLRRAGHADGVHAFTTTVEGLDRNEGHYARLVASHLGIPISVEAGGAAAFDPEWSTRRIHTPTPIRDVTTLLSARQSYRVMSRHAPVAFYGEGPDNALQYEWKSYFRFLVRTRRYARLAGDIARHVRSHRRLPLMNLLPRLLRARRDRGRWDVPYPQWLEPGLERRLDLRNRWEHYQDLPAPAVIHPVRPAAHMSFSGCEWEALFRGFDAEETGAPLDVRHPYVDIRLLRYLLSVPAVPWCRSKHLVRRAMRHELPVDVLQRPKSGMTGDADYETVKRAGLPPLLAEDRLRAFVDPARVPDALHSSMIAFRADFRPRALNFWFSHLQGARQQVDEEHEHDVAHA